MQQFLIVTMSRADARLLTMTAALWLTAFIGLGGLG